MTRQQIELECGIAVGYLSCMTELGIEYLKRYHSGTITLLRLWQRNMILFTGAGIQSVKLLVNAISAVKNDPTMYRASPTQLSFEV